MTYSQSVTSGATESGAEPVLSVRSLRKAYNVGRPTEKLAIGDVSFDVAKGEFVCVVGPSGAGKTTMLRCLSGLLPPTTGEVRFEGRKLQAVPDRLSVVFQDYSRSLFPWLTVNRNVAVPLKVAGVAKKEREARIQEVLHAVGLGDVGKSYPWQLSGGMQQRVQIARALVMRPRVLLMDEPFGALDAMTKTQLQDELLRVREVTGATVVFVTHDVDEAVYLSDRVLVLSGSPARVTTELDVDLPSPRDQVATKEDPKYLRIRHSVYETLKGVHQ